MATFRQSAGSANRPSGPGRDPLLPVPKYSPSARNGLAAALTRLGDAIQGSGVTVRPGRAIHLGAEDAAIDGRLEDLLHEEDEDSEEGQVAPAPAQPRSRAALSKEQKASAADARAAELRHSSFLRSVAQLVPCVAHDATCHDCRSSLLAGVGVCCTDCAGTGSSRPPCLRCAECDRLAHLERWHFRTAVCPPPPPCGNDAPHDVHRVEFEAPLREGYRLSPNDFVGAVTAIRAGVRSTRAWRIVVGEHTHAHLQPSHFAIAHSRAALCSGLVVLQPSHCPW